MTGDKQTNMGLTAYEASLVAGHQFSGDLAVPCAVCSRTNAGKSPGMAVLWPPEAFEYRPFGGRMADVDGRGQIEAFRLDMPLTRLKRSETCARCLYIGRFNAANRLAAERGDVLPVWGMWQPLSEVAEFGYNPFTGRLLLLGRLVDGRHWPVKAEEQGLRRAPRGWQLLADGTARRCATPEGAEPVQAALPVPPVPPAEQPEKPDPKRPWATSEVVKSAANGTPIPAKYPFKCHTCGRLGDAGEPVIFRTAGDERRTIHWSCWNAGGLRVAGPQLARDAARLFAAGYRRADFAALVECGEALDGGRCENLSEVRGWEARKQEPFRLRITRTA